MSWWQYLLLVNLYLVLFYGFYVLLLRRETFFQLNRTYLVSAALLSFFIPLMQMRWVQDLFITQKVEYTIYSNAVAIHSFRPVEAARVNFGELFVCMYVAGIIFLGLRLVWQLFKLHKIIRLPAQGTSYSFFKKIKLDVQAQGSQVINAHEEVHAKQWHSADVLIMEAVMIINWFNPVVYYYRRSLKHIHEFIADSHASKTADSKSDYALLLLSQTFNVPQHRLANHFFNNSLLKQRLIMLQKNRSQRMALLKYGLSAPLFILMLILSSATVNNSKAVKLINIKARQVFAAPTIPDAIVLDPPVVVCDSTSLSDSTQMLKITMPDTGLKTDTMQKNEIVFSAVEKEPEFIGGPETFASYMAANVKYPATMRDNNIQGKVIVTFIVEPNGSISGVKALKGPCPEAITEAERVITSTSGKWMPGEQNHQYVRVRYTVPVAFSLSDAAGSRVVNNTRPDTAVKVARLSYSTYPKEPLYILDGKQIKPDGITQVTPNEIGSVNVLRDKSATLLYGKDGANGVIVINLKKKPADVIISAQVK